MDHAFAIGVKRIVFVCPRRLRASKKGWKQFHSHRPGRFNNLIWRDDYFRKSGSLDLALAIRIWENPKKGFHFLAA